MTNFDLFTKEQDKLQDLQYQTERLIAYRKALVEHMSGKVQEPINRMSTASAIFKGFVATIVSGIAALTYCDVNATVLALSFVPVLLFMLLDIYYLKLEKKYRFLFDQVRKDEHPVDFSMELTKENSAAKSRVWDCLKSPSIWLFYPAIIIILVIVYILKIKGVL